MVVVFVLYVNVLMQLWEALTQGNSQQQFQYWHSSAHARKICVLNMSE